MAGGRRGLARQSREPHSKEPSRPRARCPGPRPDRAKPQVPGRRRQPAAPGAPAQPPPPQERAGRPAAVPAQPTRAGEERRITLGRTDRPRFKTHDEDPETLILSAEKSKGDSHNGPMTEGLFISYAAVHLKSNQRASLGPRSHTFVF
nr:MAP7 domain-containing protein 1-like [Manis javanica]